jgi:heme-degrading monooxygenase HmoA
MNQSDGPARVWHGIVLKENADRYHRFLLDTGLSDYTTTIGNCGVFLLKKDAEKITHFYTLTFWNDLESIKRFAGPDVRKARYYPEDKDFLLEFEEEVNHFDVLEMQDYVKI